MIHEEEIADLREQQQKMLATREAEMAELRRLEEQEDRLQGEKVSSDAMPTELFYIHFL